MHQIIDYFHFHYFSKRLNREVKALYWHTFLSNLALSLVFIFEPIYLFTLGYSPIRILWFYIMVYGAYIVLIAFGARFAGRYGYKHSIFLSNVFYIIYWIVLFSVRAYPILFFVAPVIFALQKSFLWPAYNADISISTKAPQRGREVGALFAIMQLAFIMGPFFGGLISEKIGFWLLFLMASGLMVGSIYPLMRTPEVYSKHRFEWKNFWDIFRKQKRTFFGLFGYAEWLVMISLWPIYMYMIISDFSRIGAVSMIATMIGTVLMLYVGKLTDRIKKGALVIVASVIYGMTWIFRFFATSLPSVLIFDSLGKASRNFVSVPVLTIALENASKKDADYAIAYHVFYEVSLSLAVVVTALLGILILALTGSIFMVFMLAGFMTMLYGLLK